MGTILENILDALGCDDTFSRAQRKYLHELKKGDIERVILLEKLTGIKLSEEVVQEVYTYFLLYLHRNTDATQENGLDYVEHLQKATGIKPNKEDVIQAFQESYHHLMYWRNYWDRLYRLTGIMPPKDTIQSLYTKSILGNNPESLEALMDMTKVKISEKNSKLLLKTAFKIKKY